MRWQTEYYEEPMYYGSRWQLMRRRLRQLLWLIGLAGGLLFFTLHPTGRWMTEGLWSGSQTVWNFSVERFERYFGPELILRRRAERMIQSLRVEQRALVEIEQQSTAALQEITTTIPALAQMRNAAQQELRFLVVQLEGESPPTALVRNRHEPGNEGQIISQAILRHQSAQHELARYRQALRVYTTAVAAAGMLNEDMQDQLEGLEQTLHLFESRWRKVEGEQAGLTEQEVHVLRSALQSQLAQAATMRQAHRALTASLAKSR